MVQNLLTQLSELIVNSEDIRLDEIPEYRLYISQLEEFFDKKLGKGNGDDEERKVISKTMIQNYIKDGLLMSPEGKSYNRNHAIPVNRLAEYMKGYWVHITTPFYSNYMVRSSHSQV